MYTKQSENQQPTKILDKINVCKTQQQYFHLITSITTLLFRNNPI